MTMKSLTITYPEAMLAVLNVSTETFESEAKMALAAKLFEMGKLTSGQAAEIAGIPRVRFLFECGRYGVPSVAWDQDEINAEFHNRLRLG